MILDVMFIHKEENNDIDLFKQMFQNIILFEQKSLCLDDLRFSYSIQKSEAQKGIRLKVVTLEDKSTKKEADNITTLKSALSRGKHRRDYHIAYIFDGASEYYCNKLSRFISIFERKLRQFIYINVLDTYGKDWVKETLTDEIQTEVTKKGGNKNHHIEMAFECFEFKDYINYLFKKRSDDDPYDVLQEVLKVLEGGNASNVKIINMLKKGEKVSLWDKLFKGFNIDFTENEIDRLRRIRNKIMHNKEISALEFAEYKKLLRSSIKKIDEGIFNAERQKYSPNVNVADVLRSLNDTMQSMKQMSESIIEALAPAISEIQKMSHKLVETINSSGFSEKVKNLSLTLKNSYVDTLSLNTKEISNSIAALQKSLVVPCIDYSNIVQASLPNITLPVLENTKHLNLGLNKYFNSSIYNAIKPPKQNLIKSQLGSSAQIDNEDEVFKHTDISGNKGEGE